MDSVKLGLALLVPNKVFVVSLILLLKVHSDFFKEVKKSSAVIEFMLYDFSFYLQYPFIVDSF